VRAIIACAARCSPIRLFWIDVGKRKVEIHGIGSFRVARNRSTDPEIENSLLERLAAKLAVGILLEEIR